jgi:hypothetical protein
MSLTALDGADIAFSCSSVSTGAGLARELQTAGRCLELHHADEERRTDVAAQSLALLLTSCLEVGSTGASSNLQVIVIIAYKIIGPATAKCNISNLVIAGDVKAESSDRDRRQLNLPRWFVSSSQSPDTISVDSAWINPER